MLSTDAHARLQEAIDQAQQADIRATTLQSRHQPVMVDPVKKALRVHVDHPAVALPNRGLHMADRLVRRAVGAEAVAVRVEVGFPLRGQHLRDGLAG